MNKEGLREVIFKNLLGVSDPRGYLREEGGGSPRALAGVESMPVSGRQRPGWLCGWPKGKR